jgi:uncharacterized protein (TIGR01777 family)
MAKIVIAGGSGFMGQVLAKHYIDKGDRVVIFTRGASRQEDNISYIKWDATNLGDWMVELEGADVLINLNGKSVNCRYNVHNRAEVFRSRVNATRVLGKALKSVNHPPELWINAASATIYRHAEDRPQDEETGELGTGFSVEVCKQWEASFFEQRIPGVRQVALRTAIVLGKDGGVTPYYFNLAKFGLGGIQGNGNQYFSWIYEDDLTGIVDFLTKNKKLSGVFNASSPNPVPNRVLMGILRKEVHMPFGLPATKWMLKMGAFLLGTETELILKSRWVLPKRLLEAGYRFKVTDIKRAAHLCRPV